MVGQAELTLIPALVVLRSISNLIYRDTHMKHNLTLGLLLGSCAVMQAEAISMKICVYDPEALASQSDEWRAMVLEIDKRYQKEAEGIKTEEAKLQETAKNLNSKMAVLSETSREAEARSLNNKKRDLDTKAERLVKDYQEERQGANMRFYRSLEAGVSGYATAKGYDMAIPKGPGLFAKAEADQTQAISKYMNESYASRKNNALAAKPMTVAKK
jgi:Skp family chaperone for outer membrane proteins